MSIAKARTPVQEILRQRPYLRWDLVPLAAYLCEEGYSTVCRNIVIDGIAAGRSLQHLVEAGELEPADLPGAEHALRRGRNRTNRRAGRAVRTIADLLNVIVGSLRACGVEPEEASLDESGFDVRLGDHPLRIAFIPPVSGGAPDAPEETDGMLDHLSDEQVDAMAADFAPPEDPELVPEDFELLPLDSDAPDNGRSWSDHLAELIATGRTAAVRPIRGGSPDPIGSDPIGSGPTVEQVREWYRTHPMPADVREASRD